MRMGQLGSLVSPHRAWGTPRNGHQTNAKPRTHSGLLTASSSDQESQPCNIRTFLTENNTRAWLR